MKASIARAAPHGATRHALPSGGWIELWDRFVGESHAHDMLHRLIAELAWERRSIVLFGREVLQPRLVAWAGSVPYRYSGQTLEPRDAPSALTEIWTSTRAETRVEFNHVLVNRYRDGRDSMGLHSDDEPELGENPTVASLSFGATRRFVMRSRTDKREPKRVIELRDGALLVMGGACQHRYRHEIPKVAGDVGERVSLTFRRIESG